MLLFVLLVGGMEKHDAILLSAYKNDIVCYTDASVKDGENGISVCVVFPETIWLFAEHLQNYCVTSCEFFAIQCCLEKLFLSLHSLQDTKNIFIFSDSSCALQLLYNIFLKYPINNYHVNTDGKLFVISWDTIFYLRFMASAIMQHNITINFHWIKSHAGIPGNERVDELAKAVRRKPYHEININKKE